MFCLFLFQNLEPVGVVGFTDIHNRTANLGYYKNPFTKKTGIGKLLINKACEYAACMFQKAF